MATRGLVVASVSFVALVVSIAVLVALQARQEEDDLLVNHSFQVRAAIQDVRGLLTDAETGVRGFLLTDDADFLQPYTQARIDLDLALDRLDGLVADDEPQSARVALVRRAAERRLELLESLRGPDSVDTRQENLSFGKALMDGIRQDLSDMESEQDRLLAERTAAAEQTREVLTALIPVAGMVGVLGLFATVGFGTRLARRVVRITDNAVRLGSGLPLAPLRHTDDEIGRLDGALIDAAAILRTREEELFTAREFLEYLIDEGPVVMFRKRLDATEELTYISPNVERVLGVPHDTAMATARFLASRLDGEHREAFNQGVRAAARGEVRGWYGEYQTVATHGRERWVAVDVKVQVGDGSEPKHLLGYVLDITDRVSASSAARIAEQNYFRLFERVPTAIVGTTPEGEIVDVNPAMARMVGYDTPEDLMAEVPNIAAVYVDPQERDRFVDALRVKGSVADYESRFRHLDGRILDVTINAQLVTDAEGTPVEIHGTAIDVTARRRAEEETRRAQAEADRANQAKSIFLSRMSHELRTPLNSIIGFAQLLEMSEPPLDARSGESVTHILKAGRHLLELIDEVLDIAQVEAGRLNMSLEVVDIGDPVAESVDLIRPLAAARDITLQVDDTSDQQVLADRQRVKQVFLNLLSNAVKYNARGGSVTVSFAVTDNDLRVSFADSGPGMNDEQLARLFTPFDRLGAERSGQDGTGLGLVLSRQLVEAMNGELSVESTPGRGTTFTVSLPRPASTATIHLPVADTPAGPPPSVASGPPRTVIYIEDNLANLRLIERVLALRPHITLEAAMRATLGIDLVREHDPDLVLLDLNLPDIGGRDVLLELKSDPATRHIPVLVISADASAGQVQRLRDAGADGYLTKPVDVIALLRYLDDTLG